MSESIFVLPLPMRSLKIAALAAASASSLSAATIYLDNFSVTQNLSATVKNQTLTSTTTTPSDTIFGGYRTLILTSNKNGTLQAPSATLTVGNGSLALSAVNSASTDTIIKWAGANGAGIPGGFNILVGGSTASSYLTFSFVDSNKGASFEWIVTDTSGNIATKSYNYAANITNATATDALSTFSESTTDAGGNINWTSIASIQLVDHGGGGYNIKYQNMLLSSTNPPGTAEAPNTLLPTPTLPSPVPEASTYGISLGGLALAAAVVRRRKQAK